MNADILVVVVHPDDETELSGYLARAIFDGHRRVAVIFGTHGDGGGDATGQEQAAALGAERGIEARRALAVLGVTNILFLGGWTGYPGPGCTSLAGNLEPRSLAGAGGTPDSADAA